MPQKKGHKEYANYQGGSRKQTIKKTMRHHSFISKHLFGMKQARLALAK